MKNVDLQKIIYMNTLIAQIQVEALTHISKNLEDTDHYLLKKRIVKQRQQQLHRAVLSNILQI